MTRDEERVLRGGRTVMRLRMMNGSMFMKTSRVSE